MQRRPHGGQLRRRRLAAKRRLLPGQVGRKNQRTERQSDRPQRQVAPDPPPVPTTERRRQPQQREGQQQRVRMPAQKQRRAGLRQQLPEPAFGDERRHAVQDQHEAEQIDDALGGDHVVEVQRIVGGERQQGRRQGGPAAAHQSAQGKICERRGGGEEGQHQPPCGGQPRGAVVGEGQRGELDQCMPEHGEAVVRVVFGLAGFVQAPAVEAEKVVLRRQVQGHRHVVQSNVVMPIFLMEVAAAAAEKEHRGQRQEQQGEGRRGRTPPPAAIRTGRRTHGLPFSAPHKSVETQLNPPCRKSDPASAWAQKKSKKVLTGGRKPV